MSVDQACSADFPERVRLISWNYNCIVFAPPLAGVPFVPVYGSYDTRTMDLSSKKSHERLFLMPTKSPELSKRLLELAKSKGLNNKQFAEFVGISENAATYYLKKGRVPETTQIVKIAERFGVSIDWLLSDLFEDTSKHDSSNPCEGAFLPKASTRENEQLLRLTNEVLESGTGYADVLDASIRAFHQSIVTQNRLDTLESEFSEMKKTIAALMRRDRRQGERRQNPDPPSPDSK